MIKNDRFKQLGHVDISALDSKKIKHDLRQLKRAERCLFKNKVSTQKKTDKEQEEFILTDYKQYLKFVSFGLSENFYYTPSIISVFVGSPYPDFSDERNALFYRAHYNLKQFCKKKNLELIWIDLRWALDEQEILSKEFSDLSRWCIDTCSQESLGPSSVQLLGNRYGDQEVPYSIESKEFQIILNLARKNFKPLARMLLEWYREDENSIPPNYILQPSRLSLEEAKPSDLDPTLKISDEGESEKKSNVIVPERKVDLTKIESPADWTEAKPMLKDLLVRAVDYSCDLGQMPQSRLRHYKLSALELEVKATISQEKGPPPNSKCLYSRTIENIQNDSSLENAEQYFDISKSDDRAPILHQEKMELIKELRQRYTSLIKNSDGIEKTFSINWSDFIDGTVPKSYVETFTDTVLNDLQSQIELHLNNVQVKQEFGFMKEAAEFNHRVTHLVKEIQHHCRLRDIFASDFCGRSAAMDWIKHWLLDQSNLSLAFIHGPSASGKSALVARTDQLANKWYAKTSVVKVIRFVGSSCDSLCLENLLVSIIRQLAVAYDLEVNESRMKMLQSIVLYFHDVLHHISVNYGKQRPLFMFLDGLDYLEEDEFSKSLKWLPDSLPCFVKLMVSSSVYYETDDVQLVDILNMEPMSDRTCRDLITALLKREHRTITATQLDAAVERILHTGLPLHAKFVARAATMWSSYDDPRIMFDGEFLEEIVNRYFDYLEQKHGCVLVSYALGYITVSHVGLSLSELEDLLSCNNDVLQEVFESRDPPPKNIIRLPPFVFMSLRFDLEQLLRPSFLHGVSALYWKNSSVAQIAYGRYVTDETFFTLHRHMSDFYMSLEPIKKNLSLRTKRGDYSCPDADRFVNHLTMDMKHQLPRKLRCIVHHLTHSQQLLTFKESVACNFSMLNIWIYEFKPRRTVAMLKSAMNTLKKSSNMELDVEIKAVHDVLYQCRLLLERDPTQFAEQLLGRLVNFKEHDGGLVGSACPDIRRLCDDCRAHLSTCGSADVKIGKSFYLEPVFPCLPSNLRAVKWYHETVKHIYQISKCQNYILLLVYNPDRLLSLSMFDTRITECTWTVPAIEEPIDAQINFSITLVFALYRKDIVVYNLADGQVICSLHNTVAGYSNPINSCLAISQKDKAIATATEDKIAVYFNKGSLDDHRTASFQFEKLISVKLSHRFVASTSMDTEKVSLLVTAYISKNEGGLIAIRAANFDTHESLSSICLPPLRDLYQQIANPLLSHHMVPVGNTGKVVVLLADGQVFMIDLFAPAILWQYQEPLNPNYLKIEYPRLKYFLTDTRTNCVLFTIKYGPDVFLRIYDIEKSQFIFFLKSSEPYEQIESVCLTETQTIVIGGNKGSCVAMDLEFAQNQVANSIFKEHKLKTAFKAYYSPVRFLFFKNNHLLSLDNKMLLKSWLFREITASYYSKLTLERQSTLLHNEPVRCICVTSDKNLIVTSSQRLVKVWKIEDGSWIRTLRLKWVSPDGLGEYIEDCTKLSLSDNDKYIVCESKMKNILFVAKFEEGVVLSCVKYPLVWCCSRSYFQGNPLVAVIYSKDNCKFTLKILSVPSLRCLLVKYFYSPHPGIEESVRELCFTENQEYILLKWSQKLSDSFEGLMFNICPNHPSNLQDNDKVSDESDESDSESPPNNDSINAKSGLVICGQSSQKSSLGGSSANKLFWKITTWLPATSVEKVFVGALSGQIPVWHLNSGDCQIPCLPCMEAWMKHSVTVTYVKPGVKPPARRTYDELSVKKSPITALACSSASDVHTGMPNVLASGAKDGSIIVWHYKKAALERDYDLMKSWGYRLIIRNAHSVQICALFFMKGDEMLLSSGLDSNICIISTKDGSIINRLYISTPVQQFLPVNKTEYVLAKCANDSEQRIFIFKLTSPKTA